MNQQSAIEDYFSYTETGVNWIRASQIIRRVVLVDVTLSTWCPVLWGHRLQHQQHYLMLRLYTPAYTESAGIESRNQLGGRSSLAHFVLYTCTSINSWNAFKCTYRKRKRKDDWTIRVRFLPRSVLKRSNGNQNPHRHHRHHPPLTFSSYDEWPVPTPLVPVAQSHSRATYLRRVRVVTSFPALASGRLLLTQIFCCCANWHGSEQCQKRLATTIAAVVGAAPALFDNSCVYWSSRNEIVHACVRVHFTKS